MLTILSYISQSAALEATALAAQITRASSIKSSEYDSTFQFGDFILEEFASIFPALSASKQIRTREFLSTYTKTMSARKESGLVADVQFVQPESEILLKRMMDITFKKKEVTYVSERSYTCSYRGANYRGKTDHVIISSLRDAAVLVWEDKALDIDFTQRGARKSALCQVAAEMYSEVHQMSYRYNYTAQHFCGILTNGTSWILVVYYLNLGVQQWRHCREIVSTNNEGLRRVAVMLGFALASARHHVDALKKNTITASPHITDNIVDIDDDEDGDNGDVTGTDSIGALTKSIVTTLQITGKTSSTDGGNKNRVSGRSGDSAKYQKSMLPLTEYHLALHNKGSYVIPRTCREIIAKLYQGTT